MRQHTINKVSYIKTTENQQDNIIHQLLQTEDCYPDDMKSMKTKRSAFESSSDIRPKHNKGENNINLLLATNSCMSHPASKYRPSIAMLGHDVKLPPNLLEPYPKPGKPPDDHVMAMRDHNTMIGERHYKEGDHLLLIRRGSTLDRLPSLRDSTQLSTEPGARRPVEHNMIDWD